MEGVPAEKIQDEGALPPRAISEFVIIKGRTRESALPPRVPRSARIREFVSRGALS